MGVRLWRSFFVLWWVYFFVISADKICEFNGCTCNEKAAAWKTVNCTLKDLQNLHLNSHHVPDQTSEIFISGGAQVILGPESFRSLRGLSLFYIKNTRKIIMEKQSFHNLTHPSLHIQIYNCDQLNIKTGAFEHVQSSIEVTISRCASARVEKSAFNKLQTACFKDIETLTLDEETFELKNQAISKHGLVTIISFDNVKIPTIPPRTFFSSLSEIRIKNSIINDVQSNAFWASQIETILITNSRIDYLRTDAFGGRTLILNFKMSNCTVKKIETGAIVAAFSNLTVEHSRITDIETGAINNTVANADITGNEIANFRSMGFVFHDWNRILIEQNLIKFLHSNFLVAPIPVNVEVVEVSFVSNDVFNVYPGALSFVPELEDRVFLFKNNFFNQTCHCNTDEWIVELTTANVTSKKKLIMNNTFCTVNDLLSKCFELQVGAINLQNFTELVCNTNNTIICEKYKGETKIVNTTSVMFTEDVPPAESNWIVLIISLTAVLLGSVVVTFIVMLVKGSRWLKRKGYFRNIQYSQNEHSNDEENTIETVDENDKADISEDLTMELLQDLSKKLDDPNTHQEASEMIEQLYQKYIRNNGSENNNQQEEEAHLYEELGNLQLADPDPSKQQNGPRSILRLMEERFNTQFEDIDADDTRPALVGEYSEPSDAAVHLYSELKQNKDSESENRDSLKSRASSNMAFRPLPDKPGSSKM